MLIETKFDSDSDIIDCPDEILEHIKDYQEQFWKWLFDKSNDHGYWIYENGQKYGCSYRADAFVEWLISMYLIPVTRKQK